MLLITAASGTEWTALHAHTHTHTLVSLGHKANVEALTLPAGSNANNRSIKQGGDQWS